MRRKYVLRQPGSCLRRRNLQWVRGCFSDRTERLHLERTEYQIELPTCPAMPGAMNRPALLAVRGRCFANFKSLADARCARPGTREDAAVCGIIGFEAFKSISSQHNFHGIFLPPRLRQPWLRQCVPNPGFYCVVAELDGRVVAGNFLEEPNSVSDVEPISVDGRYRIGAPVAI